MIGRLHHVVIDCPEPAALAGFYSELLGLPVVFLSDDWVVIASARDTSGIAFQLAPEHVAPSWPEPGAPQQFHLDVMVDDVEAAAQRVLALGATRLPAPAGSPAVFADPAGHPFCLIRRPAWAPPVG